LKFLAMFRSLASLSCFMFNSSKMIIKQPVGYGNVLVVPPCVACLVAAQQENGAAAWVKCEEHPIRTARMLNPEFFHIRVTRSLYSIGMRPAKRGSQLLQQSHLGVNIHLLILR